MCIPPLFNRNLLLSNFTMKIHPFMLFGYCIQFIEILGKVSVIINFVIVRFQRLYILYKNCFILVIVTFQCIYISYQPGFILVIVNCQGIHILYQPGFILVIVNCQRVYILYQSCFIFESYQLFTGVVEETVVSFQSQMKFWNRILVQVFTNT